MGGGGVWGTGGDNAIGGVGAATGAPFLLFLFAMTPVEFLRLLTGRVRDTRGLKEMGGGTISVGEACLSAPTSIVILQPPSSKV